MHWRKSSKHTELSTDSAVNAPKLQVLICTCGNGLNRIDPQGLPQIPGVEYLVSRQKSQGEVPGRLASRLDIRILHATGTGLSNNRNSAFDASSAPYLLIADDDLSFRADGLIEIIRLFDADPSMGLLTFRSVRDEGQVYPPNGHDLSRPFRGYEATSFEIAVRRCSLVESGVRFSPLAGIGAPSLCAAEENLFVWHLLRAGVKGRFRAFDCAVHPAATTSVRRASEAPMLRTKGAYAARIQNPLKALVRLPLLALRAPVAWPRAMCWLLQGWAYGLKNRKLL